MTKLHNKVALITGGTTGIGLATAKLFIEQGAQVIVTGRNPETLSAAEGELAGKAQVVRSDVSSLDDIGNLVNIIKERHGRIDVLFANAGVANFLPIEAADEAHLDTQFNINFKGPYFLLQKALPLLSEGASVILNSSVAAQRGMGGSSVYAATKAALSSLGRTLAVELAPRGVRVNVISPGPIDTPIYGKLGLPADAVDGFKSTLSGSVALKRFAQSAEVANVALFLASSDATYITGQDIAVDGGLSTLLAQG